MQRQRTTEMEAEGETEVKMIGIEIGSETPELEKMKAVSQCNDNPDAVINCIVNASISVSPPLTVNKTLTSTGARISVQIDEQIHQDSWKMLGKVKEEADEKGVYENGGGTNVQVKDEGDAVKGENSVNEKKSTSVIVYPRKIDFMERFAEWLKLPENNRHHKKESPQIVEPVNHDFISTDARISTQIDEQNHQDAEGSGFSDGVKMMRKVKEEVDESVLGNGIGGNVKVKGESHVGLEEKKSTRNNRQKDFDEWLKLPEHNPHHKEENPREVETMTVCKFEVESNVKVENMAVVKPQAMAVSVAPKQENEVKAVVKKEVEEVISAQPLSARKMSYEEYKRIRLSMSAGSNIPKKGRVEDRTLSTVVIEDGDFPGEPDWLLVGRNVVMGLSTTKGRKLENNEIVHFSFPVGDARNRYNSQFVSAKAASAASEIVRFSTKRNGEIGRLPMEWAKCLIPLVRSSKVKVLGRCIAAPANLQLMQEVMLYLSFYIHHSVITEGKSTWKLDSPSQIDSTIYPLLTLFKLLSMKPFQEAEFTPEELYSRKRFLKLSDDSDETLSVLPMLKRRMGSIPCSEYSKDEETISESSLNKLVGAADIYDLKEMEPPETLLCDLRPYQKQALFWMTESEKGVDVDEAAKTLHPCWEAYHISDERAPAIYVNIFSGEATTKFPTAIEMARGGILADEMGLGKTVMTITLILARRGRGSPDNQEFGSQDVKEIAQTKKNRREKDYDQNVIRKLKGGTLIVCPMALLGQWKDELEAHSQTDSLSVSIYYGVGRSSDPKAIAEPDVILTTYGVLTAAYKDDGVNSIFHRVEWYRVVLDEAHTIKSSRTQAAQAAYTLSSYCRWCLTGTPLQNKLEDLYSLLCFLHVEPWCNWAWWQKLIQKPYENGDMRGLKLVKAILRPLMLRRTKDTKDKEGRPILVLPPTDIRVIECEQSEAENDFYQALFKRSKVQFDQFVAQGKVLHNYANILELLLRLRQCCNHPFLVMSRGDTQQYSDLDKLARRFLETNTDSANQKLPSRAYINEVVESLRKGESAECPVCLESADDPVLTPCAHRMCRDCLLSCWRTPSAGACPVCRLLLSKTDLITCPSENRFRIDVEKNWKESSKVSKLLECLELILRSGSGEKSIVFSQWTSFLDLLEIPLRRRWMGYLRFDGDVSQKRREKVLKEFSESEEKRILLMSLKAGGVGLNLTAASNVFLMDPWWNPAVEEQAIMRIHRIGQKRTVRVRRFIVKDTVEQRMQQVQARKQRMIAGALTDEEVRSARIEELKMLFR